MVEFVVIRKSLFSPRGRPAARATSLYTTDYFMMSSTFFSYLSNAYFSAQRLPSLRRGMRPRRVGTRRGARRRRFGAPRRLSQAGGRVDTLDGAAGPAGEGCPGAAASGIFHTTVLKLQMMDGRIFQLNCSDGGVPKLAVREAFLTPTGLEGDRQGDTRIHGGPERALCLYALERILELQREGHPVFPGSVGENVTVVGLDWQRLEPGSRLALGEEAVVEVTRYTSPCKNIADSFAGRDFKRISQKDHPGYSRVYARVLRTGRLVVGQAVRLLDGSSA